MNLLFKNKLFLACKYCLNEMREMVVHQFSRHNFIMVSDEPSGRNRYLDVTGLLNYL